MEQILVGGADGDVVNVGYRCMGYINLLREKHKIDPAYKPYEVDVHDLIMTIVHDSECELPLPPEFWHPNILSELYPIKLQIPIIYCPADGSIWPMLDLWQEKIIEVENYYTKILKLKQPKKSVSVSH